MKFRYFLRHCCIWSVLDFQVHISKRKLEEYGENLWKKSNGFVRNPSFLCIFLCLVFERKLKIQQAKNKRPPKWRRRIKLSIDLIFRIRNGLASLTVLEWAWELIDRTTLTFFEFLFWFRYLGFRKSNITRRSRQIKKTKKMEMDFSFSIFF